MKLAVPFPLGFREPVNIQVSMYSIGQSSSKNSIPVPEGTEVPYGTEVKVAYAEDSTTSVGAAGASPVDSGAPSLGVGVTLASPAPVVGAPSVVGAGAGAVSDGSTSVGAVVPGAGVEEAGSSDGGALAASPGCFASGTSSLTVEEVSVERPQSEATELKVPP